MLTKVQATVMLVIGTLFSAFEIWQITSPVSKDILEVLVAAIFALLAVLFPASKLYQAIKFDVTKEKVEGLK